MPRNQKRGKDQPLSLKQEHDNQYKLVHKRLSKLVETAPDENIKEMCSLMLQAWEEAVLEVSKTGEAFALYGTSKEGVLPVKSSSIWNREPFFAHCLA